jgi:hypothetical protein
MSKKYEPSVTGDIPITVQPPNKPEKERLIGYASRATSPAAILHKIGIAPSDAMDVKLIRSTKHGDRWSIVIW